MKSRRTLMVVVALFLAVAAFVGVVLYANSVRTSAYGDAKLVKVFVVKKDIPKGLAGEQAISQEYVKSGDIPQQYRPGSAISNLEDIKNKVAITALSPGQVIVNGQFVDPNVAQVTFAQRVPTDQVAITVSVDQIHGVAGLLLPGDKVNLMTIRAASATEKDSKVASTLYQNVNILAIGTKAAPQAGDTTSDAANANESTGDSGLITFAVPLEAAERIALASSGGPDGSYVLYLALVPPDNTAKPAPAIVGASNITPSELTPYPNA